MHKIRSLVALGLLVMVPTIAACSSGASDADMTALQDQLTAEKQKSAALQEQLSAQQSDMSTTEQATTDGMAAGDENSFVLLAGKSGPTAEPPPPPTAPPADYVAPTKAPPPDTLYEAVGPFSFYVETLATTHVSEYGYSSEVSCIQSGTFRRGMRVVWRFEVFDMATDKRITDKDEATVKVVLPNGDEAEAHFSQRGGGRVPDAPWMWSANWDIPLDYPLGGLDYGIVVQLADGTTQEWHEPAVISEESDTRPQIIDG
jgi:hypothetical protein